MLQMTSLGSYGVLLQLVTLRFLDLPGVASSEGSSNSTSSGCGSSDSREQVPTKFSLLLFIVGHEIRRR